MLALTVVVTAPLTWRAATLRVDRTDHGLVVRNLWRTYRLPWAEVVAYERRWSLLTSGRWYRAYCPVAVTRRRRVPLLALAGDESWADRRLPPPAAPGDPAGAPGASRGIRPPTGARVLLTLRALLATVPSWLLLLAGAWAFAVVAAAAAYGAYRAWTVALRPEPDALVVRNLARTSRVPWGAVTGTLVMPGGSSWSPYSHVALQRGNDVVALDALPAWRREGYDELLRWLAASRRQPAGRQP